MFRTVLLFSCVIGSLVHTSPIQQHQLLTRRQRSTDGRLGCVNMESFPGDYWFVSEGSEQVCGVYLIGLSDQVVELEFHGFDIDCKTGGLLSIVDGWELGGQFFPTPDDHAILMDERYKTFCGNNKPHKVYLSSQNVALIQYRIPQAGEMFRVSVKFPNIPQPCNVISMFHEGMYTLSNYGQKNNCSVSIIYPVVVQVVALNVGVTSELPSITMETGFRSRCSRRTVNDFVELRDGSGLDSLNLSPKLHVCGLDTQMKKSRILLGCQNSVIRLVSSGKYYNTVTFAYSAPKPHDYIGAAEVC